MQIDLRNTPYYKYFSMRKSLFGSDREDLTPEEQERVVDYNLATYLSAVPLATGGYLHHLGRKLKKLKEERKKIPDVDPSAIPVTDGRALRITGLVLAGGGATLAGIAQYRKNKLYDKKDQEFAKKRREEEADKFLKFMKEKEQQEKHYSSLEERIFGADAKATQKTAAKPKAQAAPQQQSVGLQRSQIASQRSAQKSQANAQLQQQRAGIANQKLAQQKQNRVVEQQINTNNKTNADQNRLVQLRKIQQQQQNNKPQAQFSSQRPPIVSMN